MAQNSKLCCLERESIILVAFMRIAIFCGSSLGVSSDYQAGTKYLVRAIAARGLNIIYGGGKVGLMGTVADAAIQADIHIIGVMPTSLVGSELAHPDISQLIVVKDMHERKATMAQHADAFIALPGGPGTLEEFFEAWTWAQLGLHDKPCGFFNINGFYDGLLSVFETMVSSGFMRREYIDMLQVSDDPAVLLNLLTSYVAPKPKWKK
jgi:hypothetical protein